VPERVPLGRSGSVSRAALRRWTARAARPVAGDAIAAAWTLARTIDRGGLAGASRLRPPPARNALRPWLDALAERTAEVVPVYAWRSARSLARRALDWLTAALDDPSALDPTPRDDQHERLLLRAKLFGYHGVTAGLPLATALRDIAVRLLVARAMRRVGPPDDDPALRHALPILGAVLRNHGVDGYVHRVPLAHR